MKKQKAFQSLIRCFISLVSINGFAQESSSVDRLYIEDMHLRTDKDVGYGEESSFLVWHGYLNFEFDKKEGTHSNFDNHEFYLAAHSDLHDKLSITAEFEYEHNPEKLILPIQAYADLKLSDALIIRNGIFYTPMGLPRSYNLRGNKNRMIRQVALTHDIMFENWSEVGIEVMGQFPFGLFYDVAIGNGMPNTLGKGDSWFNSVNTLQDHTEDNNNNKAIHSRFGYHNRDIIDGEVCAGISYGYEKYDEKDSLEMVHFGGDLRFLHSSGFRIQAEFMDRSGGELTDTNNISIDAMGWYFQISKRFINNTSKFLKFMEPAVQIDFIDLNKHYDTNRDMLTIALALMYSPVENYLLKFEYDIVNEQFGENVDNNTFWASIVVEF
jgi:hypothetical protein